LGNFRGFAHPKGQGPYRFEVLSPVYMVDKICRCMLGPQSFQGVKLTEDRSPQLLWITGFRAEMLKADGITPLPQEFMCQNNLNFDVKEHWVCFVTSENFRPEGIPIYKDHQYELVSVYDDTSGVDQDSMAVMFRYLLDEKF